MQKEESSARAAPSTSSLEKWRICPTCSVALPAGLGTSAETDQLRLSPPPSRFGGVNRIQKKTAWCPVLADLTCSDHRLQACCPDEATCLYCGSARIHIKWQHPVVREAIS